MILRRNLFYIREEWSSSEWFMERFLATMITVDPMILLISFSNFNPSYIITHETYSKWQSEVFWSFEPVITINLLILTRQIAGRRKNITSVQPIYKTAVHIGKIFK